MTKVDDLIAPTIHLNGTAGQVLLDQLTEAGNALLDAIKAHERAEPHGRDYYTQSEGMYGKARAQHNERSQKLRDVLTEIQALACMVADRMDR